LACGCRQVLGSCLAVPVALGRELELAVAADAGKAGDV
jgi:hypothetical protein